MHAPQELSPLSYAAAMAFTHAGRKQPSVNTAANLFKIMAYNNKDLGGVGEILYGMDLYGMFIQYNYKQVKSYKQAG